MRSHKETWTGCIVTFTIPTRSSLKVSRSVSSRSLAEKASRVFAYRTCCGRSACLINDTTNRAAQVRTTDQLRNQQRLLAALSSVCYNVGAEAGGDLVQILLFFIFIASVVLFVLVLDCALSSLEDRSSIPRWKMPQEMKRRRKSRRHRVSRRFEG